MQKEGQKVKGLDDSGALSGHGAVPKLVTSLWGTLSGTPRQNLNYSIVVLALWFPLP